MQPLVTRKAWGAKSPRGTTALLPEQVRFLVLHYSASDADEQSRHANCAKRVRAIQDYHMRPGGLGSPGGGSDIAYNWLVCKHGYVFRGRGWRVKSGATGPANAYTVAVCFLGDDTAGRDDVTDAGRAAIRQVFTFCQKQTPSVIGARGHRDFMATRCPGDELHRFARSLST